MRKILNRPLTPHLTVYSSQQTSIYSIWHRITGIGLICIIICYLTFTKFSSYAMFCFINKYLYLDLWILNTIFLNLLLLLIYHVFNGLRHIFWDLGFMLIMVEIIRSIYFINLLLFFCLLTILTKIIY